LALRYDAIKAKRAGRQSCRSRQSVERYDFADRFPRIIEVVKAYRDGPASSMVKPL
jgi:hypothetical protein